MTSWRSALFQNQSSKIEKMPCLAKCRKVHEKIAPTQRNKNFKFALVPTVHKKAQISNSKSCFVLPSSCKQKKPPKHNSRLRAKPPSIQQRLRHYPIFPRSANFAGGLTLVPNHDMQPQNHRASSAKHVPGIVIVRKS